MRRVVAHARSSTDTQLLLCCTVLSQAGCGRRMAVEHERYYGLVLGRIFLVFDQREFHKPNRRPLILRNTLSVALAQPCL